VLDNIRSGGELRRRVQGLEVAALDDEHVLFAVRLPDVTELFGERIAGQIYSVFTLRDDTIIRIDEFKTKDEALAAARAAITCPSDATVDQAIPTPRRPRSVKVQRVVPILNVTDVGESFVWFAKLGWAKGFAWDRDESGAGPDFGSVSCAGCEIFLCRDGQGSRGRGENTLTGGPQGDQTADKGSWVSIWVDDVDAIHERCLAEGLDVTYPPTDEPWGVREAHVRHPDGHVFRISKALDD
jgi:catechol 2,3-dioxygenase-like lactoylglutathione lyase family enzyme